MGKIAVIDSGIGGLTVAKEIMKRMPQEEIVYFGDQANCPYGDKTKEQITDFVYRIVDFLSRHTIKALVIACNTATSVLLPGLLQKCRFPVIGVIEPGAHDALVQTVNKRVGVIGTVKTIETMVYDRTMKEIEAEVQVFGQACPKIVPLIESAENHFEAIHLALEEYLYPLKEKGIDTLVLGCTHYPLLSQQIHRIMGQTVQLINPAVRTTTVLHQALYEAGDLIAHSSIPNHIFYTSGDTALFERHAQRILNSPVVATQVTNIFAEKKITG